MVSGLLTIERYGAPRQSHQVKAMHSATPVTASVFAALTTLLSGCIAYDAASTVVDTGVSMVSTTGGIVTSPFDSSHDDAKTK